MKKLFCTAILAAIGAFAQGAESIPFRVNMSPANEVPPIASLNASGGATLWLHVIKDTNGQVVSGTFDFNVRYQFPGEATFTGFHIHRGLAGTNGPVLIDTRITAANPVVDAVGRGEIFRPVEVAAGTANVAVLNEILANPENFYLNLHTTVNPGGAIRSQLFRTERRVYGAVMGPENEVPAITTSQARGVGFFTLLAGVDGQGVLQSAEATFDINYSGFAEGTQFTGMHIHQGRSGANGPVTIDTTLSRAQNILAGPQGAGNLKYAVDVIMTNAASVNTVYSILNDPSSGYWNLHTVANPGGEIRAPLRPTEDVRFNSLSMIPGNEVPAIAGLEASAQVSYSAHTMRLPDGKTHAAYMVFDVNYRFPLETTFTGLHLHQGVSGANGPVVLDSGIRAGSTVLSSGGNGNIYRAAFVQTSAQIAALDGLLENPRNFYINLHTR